MSLLRCPWVRVLIVGAIVCLIVLIATTGQSSAHMMPCIAHDTAAGILHQYSQSPVRRGVTEDGMIVEYWESRTGGTWTVVVRRPDGFSCFMASGEETQKIEWKAPMGLGL